MAHPAVKPSGPQVGIIAWLWERSECSAKLRERGHHHNESDRSQEPTEPNQDCGSPPRRSPNGRGRNKEDQHDLGNNEETSFHPHTLPGRLQVCNGRTFIPAEGQVDSSRSRYWAMLAFSRRSLAIGALGSMLVAALTMSGAPGAGAAADRNPLPERLSHIGDSRQVVVVTTGSWTSSYAKLQTWQKRNDGSWQQIIAPTAARVGWNGVRRAANRLQNTGTTPAGTFDLLRGFGLVRPAGVDLPYRRVDKNDWWPYDPTDPKTYNVLQPRRMQHANWRTGWAERLRSYGTQYRYSVVIDYNLPSDIRRRSGERVAVNRANTSAGGGIFLHVNGSGATAGCVSIPRKQMRQVLKWLDPDLDPVIVIGPREVIERM